MRSAHPREPMIPLITKLSVATLCLLSAPAPALGTPNVNRELQLEAEESLQLVSEQHRPSERSLLDHAWSGSDSFYGESYGGSIFFHRRHGHHHHHDRPRRWHHHGSRFVFGSDGFTIVIPGRRHSHDHRGRRHHHHHHEEYVPYVEHGECHAGTGYRGCY